MRFHWKTRTGPLAIHKIFWPRPLGEFCPCPENLCETELKDNVLNSLVEKFQDSIISGL